jgi:hypothetical protein
MTLPLDPNQKLGPSEFSHGDGMFPHPDNNFQSGKTPFPEEVPINDNYRQLVAGRRIDSMDGSETERDMMFAKGNPDRFGGQPPLVRETQIVYNKPVDDVTPPTLTREG